ncbi:MAG: DUF3842 family protein [Oscillospiraceae bacterium]
MKKRILIIDGQGGKLGRSLIEAIRAGVPDSEITAVGTNGIATANMAKGKPDLIATGENAVLVCSRSAEVIVGPIGIVIADAMLGEITAGMAAAIGQSGAKKILLPVSNHCNIMISCMNELPISALIEDVVRLLQTC